MRAAPLEPRILILCPKSRERCCLAMAFIFRKPRTPCQITNFNLSGSRGALQSALDSGRLLADFVTEVGDHLKVVADAIF